MQINLNTNLQNKNNPSFSAFKFDPLADRYLGVTKNLVFREQRFIKTMENASKTLGGDIVIKEDSKTGTLDYFFLPNKKSKSKTAKSNAKPYDFNTTATIMKQGLLFVMDLMIKSNNSMKTNLNKLKKAE